MHSFEKDDKGAREGSFGGHGSGGGWYINFDARGLDGGVLAAGRPAPEYILQLALFPDKYS